MNNVDNQAPAYEPDFELSHRDMVREDNWAEYQALGFQPFWANTDADDSLKYISFAQSEFGVGNVYTGVAYDYDEERPLRHKPGVGIYVSPEGLAYRDAQRAREATDRHAPDQPEVS